MIYSTLSDRECREQYGLPFWSYSILRWWFTDHELRVNRQSAEVIELEVERLKKVCREKKIGPAYWDQDQPA